MQAWVGKARMAGKPTSTRQARLQTRSDTIAPTNMSSRTKGLKGAPPMGIGYWVAAFVCPAPNRHFRHLVFIPAKRRKPDGPIYLCTHIPSNT